METKYIIGIAVAVLILVFLISSSISSAYSSFKSKPPVTTTPPPIQVQETIQTPFIPTNTPFRKNITTTSVPISTKLQQFADDINNTFAWKSMENVGTRDTKDLDFLRSCDKPWNAIYQIGCKIDGVLTKSQVFGPVSDANLQSPILRVGAYGDDNLCSRLNGELFVYRMRPQDPHMIDVTQNLTNITNTQPYNRKDPLFIDDYDSDC